jgi:hypothetical protein
MIASGDSQIYVVGRMPANYDSSFDKEVSKNESFADTIV